MAATGRSRRPRRDRVRLPAMPAGCSNRPMRSRLAALLLLTVPAALHAQDAGSPAAYLAQFDRDGDGRVSEAEYVEHMSRGFGQLDANGDGVLERDELPGGRGRPVTLPDYQANLRRQFRKLDRDRDGFLNLRELMQPPQG